MDAQPPPKSTKTKQKRKHTSDISRIRRRSSKSGNRSIGCTGNRLTSTQTKRRRGSTANVSSLELIPPPSTTKVVVEDGKFASNNHRIGRGARSRVKGRRVGDDRTISSDEYDTEDE